MDDERRPRRAGPIERPGASGGKRDINRRKRVQDLIDAGLSLFLRRGIEAVTIDEVAREAGMAKGNFYRYFRDKADLVEAVIEPVARTTRQAVQECDEKLRTADGRDDAVAAYGQLGNRLVGALAMHPDAMCLYLQERRAPATTARQAISDLASDLDRRAFTLSQVAVDRRLVAVANPHVSALAVLGAVEALALASVRNQVQMDPVETTKTLIAIVLEGLQN
ncbi:MAG: TetR/AcrR family transcriptional regulator [Deltaproteobacteria bacterium]|nr:TetR/AcrR family transcriptional regulator [Deltaproteobacteria bacterium]MBW2189734.1 TetR/AcrR family transcriptional regulator [Deltaproteobacteria bacterium]MBW2224650.1 TetR/AcrR family transcriptional regulator [Deltaproteobacteria bacterium]MBW2547763.1 TetR/AcrR family transcriptional regulator [Deltaproteobacteria bacterium]RLB48916.1 MAG: TetR/AcrR family transcriptional regulator [Deltaproteobacteria bacterium]